MQSTPENAKRTPTVESPPQFVADRKSTFAENYQVGNILGQGSYSVVRMATRLSDKKLVAVKIVNRSKLHKDDEENLRREVEILMSLNHPNIVKVLDFYQEEQYFYVVLEYMSGGELFDRLMEKAVYTEGEARDLAIVLLKAIQYCHDRNIVHRYYHLIALSQPTCHMAFRQRY